MRLAFWEQMAYVQKLEVYSVKEVVNNIPSFLSLFEYEPRILTPYVGNHEEPVLREVIGEGSGVGKRKSQYNKIKFEKAKELQQKERS